MATNVGVNVIEVDGRAAPDIQPAPTSIGAFIGIAERGEPNRAVRISSPAKYRQRFGGYRADAYLPHAIDGFFLNGGREAWVVRIVGAPSVAARVILDDRQAAANPTLRVTAAYRGTHDPGVWGNRLRVDVRDDPRQRTTLQAAAPGNATAAQLTSVEGINVGQVLRFDDGAVTFYRRLTAVDPATSTVSWTDVIGPGLAVTTVVTTAEFQITVRYRETPLAELLPVEVWQHLSMEADSADYVVSRINNDVRGSAYVAVSDLSGAAPSGLENPAVVSDVALASGSETAPAAADFTGSAASSTGAHALDVRAVQLVAGPDIHRLAAADRVAAMHGLLDYCAARGDCMFVGSVPDRGAPPAVVPRRLSDYTQLESDYVNTTRVFSTQFQAAKVFGALYAPFIQVTDPIAAGPVPTLFVPVDGHAMGVYARTDQERGIFKAPAGIAAIVRGALQVSASFTDEEHTSLVREALVNGVRFQTGQGIAIAASRTLSTDTRWRFINVRLLFNFVKLSLLEGLRFVRQEPHTEELRRAVRLNVIRPFLLGLWRKGAFGSDAPDDVFTIKCDAENNPPAQVNLGNFFVEVYFYPARPAEAVFIIIGQQSGGGTAEES